MTTAEHVAEARRHLLAAMEKHPGAASLDTTARLLMVAWRLLAKAVRT